MIATNPKSTWNYVLLEDRALPKEQQTVFHLKHLTLAEEHQTYDGLDRIGGVGLGRRDLGSSYLRSLRAGLSGWSNMPDGQGGFVEPKKDAFGQISDESLQRLSLNQRIELARAIENCLEITEPELERSAPPSGVPSGT